MVWWAKEVDTAFAQYEDGMENAIKDQLQAQMDQLKKLTIMVRQKLTKGDRLKIVTLMTIDVHSREVVRHLIEKKVENSACFEWLSQLRLYWDEDHGTCFVENCDSRFIYGYEYVGNCGRLVLTPLLHHTTQAQQSPATGHTKQHTMGRRLP